MSKKVLFSVLTVVILFFVGVGIYVYRTPRSQLSVTPLLTPVPEVTASSGPANCTKDQLYGSMSSEGAAGSIYVDIKITNISKSSCNLTLGNNISPQIESDNITSKYQTTSSGNVEFSLGSNESVYSRLHFPNGPQCSSGINPQNISFVYDPKGVNLQLKTDDNKNYLTIQACQGSENTQIDIWPVSSLPIK